MINAEITAVILAGGRGTRMDGADKGLALAGDRTLYQHVRDNISGQVGRVIINANRHQQIYRQSGLEVFGDSMPGFAGPLAGMLSGLQVSSTDWVLFLPCDVPDFPADLAARLWEGKQQALAAFASDEHGDHPIFALLHRSLMPALEQYLMCGERRVKGFLSMSAAQRVSFSADGHYFHNLNTPQDLERWVQG